MPKLIYSDEIEEDDANFEDLAVYRDCEENNFIASLKDGQVLLVTKEELMRGFDYRCVEAKRIALLIDKQFPNARLLRQGLGRVGRYGEACKRFHSAEIVNLIDHVERLKLVGKLS